MTTVLGTGCSNSNGAAGKLSTLITKINDDFSKALKGLGDIMLRWHMAHNIIEGLPKNTVLAFIRGANVMSRKGCAIVFCFWMIASQSAVSDTVSIDFEVSAQYPGAVLDADASNLYLDKGVTFARDRFPHHPIFQYARGSQVIRQGHLNISDTLEPFVWCPSLEINFNQAMDVRHVSLQIIDNSHTKLYTVVAFSGEDEIDRFTFTPRTRWEYDHSLNRRTVSLMAEAGETGITRIEYSPPMGEGRRCFDNAAIDNLLYETRNPVSPIAAALPPTPTISEYRAVEIKPNIEWSGRINDISVHPINPSEVFVTAETGGLWKSEDGGDTWRAITSLPSFSLNSVHHVTAQPNTILVTAKQDFQQIPLTGVSSNFTSGGGVWISRDAGRSWNLPIESVPGPDNRSSCPSKSDAFAISEDAETGRIFVSTSCGISFVDNVEDPALTLWIHNTLSTSDNYDERSIATVSALTGPGVIAGGGTGAWFSRDNGGRWTPSATRITGSTTTNDFHGSTSVQDRNSTGLLITQEISPKLWITGNGGATYTEITGVPDDGFAGGIAHVYVDPVSSSGTRVVYFGNRFDTFRGLLTIDDGGATSGTRARGSVPIWSTITENPDGSQTHEDSRALAFDGTEFSFLATDGGLDRRTDSSFWEPIRSGRNGINALQLYDVKGQHVERGNYRLAFGTQDNDFWSSDDVRDWPFQSPGEGSAITMKDETHTAREDPWTWVDLDPEKGIRLTKQHFQIGTTRPFLADGSWPGNLDSSQYGDEDNWGQSAPQRLWSGGLDGMYLQHIDDREILWRPIKLSLTPNYGESYVDIDVRFFNSPPRDNSMGPSKVAWDTVYQATKSASDYSAPIYGRGRTFENIDTLKAYNWISTGSSAAVLAPPAMNGFGSFGRYAWQFNWHAVYAVNPIDKLELIAPDVRRSRIMRSNDGGQNWTEIAGLKENLTAAGQYSFQLPHASANVMQPLVSAISFYPKNPDFVVIGLQMGGAYISQDGGTRWFRVIDSEKIPNILDFEWKSEREIYVASYGRGLWKLNPTAVRIPISDLMRALSREDSRVPGLRNIRFGSMALLPTLWDLPENSDANSEKPIPLEKMIAAGSIDAVYLVVDGKITGIKPTAKSIYDQVLLSPGASLYHFADIKLPISENEKIDISPNIAFSLPSNFVDKIGRSFTRSKINKGDFFLPTLNKNLHEQNPELARTIESKLQSVVKDEATKSKSAPLQIIGIAMKKGEVVGPVVGYQPMHRKPFAKVDMKTESYPDPPNKTKTVPYIITQSSGKGVYLGHDIFLAGSKIKLEGYHFHPKEKVSISFDGDIKTTAITDKRGYFTAVVPLQDLSTGLHMLETRSKKSSKRRITVSKAIHIKHVEND